jgi:hypothetical protein
MYTRGSHVCLSRFKFLYSVHVYPGRPVLSQTQTLGINIPPLGLFIYVLVSSEYYYLGFTCVEYTLTWSAKNGLAFIDVLDLEASTG